MPKRTPLLRVCQLLNEAGANYLICGAQACILHGLVRTMFPPGDAFMGRIGTGVFILVLCVWVGLAEENTKDPVTLETLTQTVSSVNGTAFPVGGKDSPGEKALALLVRDHVESDKLGAVCQQVAFGFHKSHEDFLRAVLEKNPHPEVLGLACLSLGQFLNNRLDRLNLLPNQSELTERYHRVFGKAFVEELQRQDRAAVAREAETLFARAADNYADVKIPVTYFGSGGTVGEKARAELFQIRNLAVGKEAPDIEGEDQDGKAFKLSDYRGKVVLLDFWHHL